MTNLKSTEKVLSFIMGQDKAVTPSFVHKQTGVEYKSVLKSIEALEKWGQLHTVSDGRLTLISCKESDKRGDFSGY